MIVLFRCDSNKCNDVAIVAMTLFGTGDGVLLRSMQYCRCLYTHRIIFNLYALNAGQVCVGDQLCQTPIFRHVCAPSLPCAGQQQQQQKSLI